MRTFIFLGILFFQFIVSFGQKTDSIGFKFYIEQHILPGPNPAFSYKVENDKIKVYKESARFGIKRKVLTKRIDYSDYKELLEILKYVNSNHYEKAYSGGYFDGINWIIKIEFQNKKTEIYFDNTKLPEFDRILRLLNSNLGKKKYITFEYLWD